MNGSKPAEGPYTKIKRAEIRKLCKFDGGVKAKKT